MSVKGSSFLRWRACEMADVTGRPHGEGSTSASVLVHGRASVQHAPHERTRLRPSADGSWLLTSGNTHPTSCRSTLDLALDLRCPDIRQNPVLWFAVRADRSNSDRRLLCD